MSEIIFNRIITYSGLASSNATIIPTYSVLIPSNTLLFPGVLEVQTRQVKVGGTTTTSATGNLRVYKNTTDSLSGATMIGNMQGVGTATVYYRQGRRYYKLFPNIDTGDGTYYMQGIAFTTANPIDYLQSTSTIAQSTTTFNPFVDNYILISAALGGTSTDSVYGSFLKILYYKES